VAVNSTVSRSARSTVLERLRTLRGSLERARDTLMHFKDDRVDRDTLEPAARRIDELMNMFASNSTDPVVVALWSAEIQSTLDKVPNPKVAHACRRRVPRSRRSLAWSQADEKISRAGVNEATFRTA